MCFHHLGRKTCVSCVNIEEKDTGETTVPDTDFIGLLYSNVVFLRSNNFTAYLFLKFNANIESSKFNLKICKCTLLHENALGHNSDYEQLVTKTVGTFNKFKTI